MNLFMIIVNYVRNENGFIAAIHAERGKLLVSIVPHPLSITLMLK